jgi:hypothetical protein
MTVCYLPEAEAERAALPPNEIAALINADNKLAALGSRLGFPHTSDVRGTTETLRELRPRQGRSRYRALYRQVGQDFVVAAVGPEAESDPRGYARAVQLALERLSKLE